ncbi:DNA polymerase III subunit beta [Pseudonocardiaceae bacterium YIM PH 21723]|nr:DNA polymerase III subunit beta [Pseudonocardiaceae bacterium YIM PH 21723]
MSVPRTTVRYMELDLTASTDRLAAAATAATRLLSSRLADPVGGGLLIDARPDGVLLSGTDRERDVRLSVPAQIGSPGQALVPGRLFAETLRSLQSGEVRLTVAEGRLTITTPSAFFALPLLDQTGYPRLPAAPPLCGRIPAAALSATVGAVAAAAARDDAVPMFTGVRLRSAADGRMSLVATDRYRMAIADLGWRPESGAELDLLVPAALLAEVVKQTAHSGEVELRADGDRFGLCWNQDQVSSTVLAARFPDEQRIIPDTVECTAEVDTDELLGALRRVARYSGPEGVLALQASSDGLLLSSGDDRSGSAQETVRATVTGEAFRAYRAKYLIDSLQQFHGHRGRLGISASRATIIQAADDDIERGELRYLVMPLRAA